MTGADPGQPGPKSDAEADRDSPFRPPETESTSCSRAGDHSVFAEPWMQPVSHPGDSLDDAAFLIPREASEDQTVWDEPGRSEELSGQIPESGLTWYRRYLEYEDQVTAAQSWLITASLAAVAGLLAVVGTLVTQSAGGTAFLKVTVLGPTTEEIMKIALPLWVVERRPWWFRSGAQIIICAFASGVAFAAVENVIYLQVYIPDASAQLIAWRWSVCVVLHAGCSTIAAWGVRRIRHRFREHQRPPLLADGMAWVMAAIVVHGVYNGTVTLMELSGFGF